MIDLKPHVTKRKNRLSSKKVTQLVKLYMNGDLVARDDKVLDVLRGELSDCGYLDEAETDTNEVE
jgi:Ran GTPase-activating protein (RanGAP) involved in mRNA processing and transport